MKWVIGVSKHLRGQKKQNEVLRFHLLPSVWVFEYRTLCKWLGDLNVACDRKSSKWPVFALAIRNGRVCSENIVRNYRGTYAN